VTALEGEGWSFGTALLPGMLRVFAPHCKPRDIVDQTRPLTWIFGQDARALEQAVERATSAKERIELLGRFLRTRRDDSELDTCLLAARIVDEAKHRPALTRVVELAERAGLSVRALERLFREYVGMTPKAVIQRYRIQEAAQRAATGAAVDWVNLAQACGYADQAHFIRDFKAQIGQTPARYASNQALS
jgi:AraC-like DNA-binding protein